MVLWAWHLSKTLLCASELVTHELVEWLLPLSIYSDCRRFSARTERPALRSPPLIPRAPCPSNPIPDSFSWATTTIRLFPKFVRVTMAFQWIQCRRPVRIHLILLLERTPPTPVQPLLMSDNRQMERKLNVPAPKSLLQANSKTDAKKSTGKL